MCLIISIKKLNNMSTKELIDRIQEDREWLSTTTGDEIECISMENLEYILSEYFRKPIKLAEQ